MGARRRGRRRVVHACAISKPAAAWTAERLPQRGRPWRRVQLLPGGRGPPGVEPGRAGARLRGRTSGRCAPRWKSISLWRSPAALAEDRSQRTAETVTLPIRTRVSLGLGRRRVEIDTDLENTARDHRLRVLFGTSAQTEVADAQGQFQVMRRAVALAAEERARVPEFDEEQEVSYHPQRAFVDVSDAAGGPGRAEPRPARIRSRAGRRAASRWG